MSTSGGSKAIIAALAANLGIAVTKFIAFLLSGSASMLAESVHSLADSGNQLLLLVGGRRARRAATPDHPFGFGRERYIYAFLVALVLFTVGGAFSIYEGSHKIAHPEALDRPLIPLVVLVVAIGLEGFSLRTALHESRVEREGLSILQFVRRATSPELPVVVLEDIAALSGLVLALLGVGATAITHNGVFDGAATVCIGLLLVAVAVVLGVETKSLLVGEGGSPELVAAIRTAAERSEDIVRVIHLRTLFLGPDQVLVGMKVAVPPTDSAREVARAIDELEVRVRAAAPMSLLLFVEPDILRTDAASGGDAHGPT